jgi:hypothetical protein
MLRANAPAVARMDCTDNPSFPISWTIHARNKIPVMVNNPQMNLPAAKEMKSLDLISFMINSPNKRTSNW